MARRRVALIGIAAILFQAFLFGWHHHALAVPGRSGSSPNVHSAAEPLLPATAENLCEICGVLHQQTAAPLAFLVPPVPSTTATAADLRGSSFIDRTATRGFDARAPPRA